MSAALNLIKQKYDIVIGLEVHCQLNTKHKLFCECSAKFGDVPNANTCPICLGLPGALPHLNLEAVEKSIMLGLALGCEIQPKSYFDRKQYFYPDLPKGFQTTQYDRPYAVGGSLTLLAGGQVPIKRIHMEEDAGKSIHSNDHSLVDLNRAGTPLVEIVTDPVIFDPETAGEFLRSIRQLVVSLGVSDGNLEEGSLRCDANVSLRLHGAALGQRCEIKNLNSYRNVVRAISYEIIRQHDILSDGKPLQRATLGFDAALGKTKIMRSKETEVDYRYFREPDLGPVSISEAVLSSIRKKLPESPLARVARFETTYDLPHELASSLALNPFLSDYFEACQKYSKTDSVKLAHWINAQLTYLLKDFEEEAIARRINPNLFALIVDAVVHDLSFSNTTAKKLLLEILEKRDREPLDMFQDAINTSKGSESALRETVRVVLAEFTRECEEYQNGKTKVISFLIGQTLKRLPFKGDPKQVAHVIEAFLKGQ